MLDGPEVLGALMLPCLIYFLNQKWYLNDNEAWMILANCFMLASLLFGGWVASLAYLIGYGYHNLFVLEAARTTHLFRRAPSNGELSVVAERCFMVSENEIKLSIYLLYFWVLIRIQSLKSLTFDLGVGTVLSSLAGWNCLIFDWTIIYAIWCLLIILAALACWYLILNDRES
jgi:hypothetical protein